MAVVLIFNAAEAEVIDPMLETALEIMPSDEPLPVIIKLKDSRVPEPFQQRSGRHLRSRMIRQLKQNAEVSQKRLLSFLQRRGVTSRIPLWLINGIAASVRPEVIRELSRLTLIERIILDEKLPHPEIAAGISAGAGWNLDALRAPELWNLGFTGEGIVVAGMDTGVDAEHPDLKDRWRGGSNSWFDPHGEHDTPHDSNGHGTQTMGVMVGGTSGGRAIGMAPGAQWIAVKIFNDADKSLLSTVHRGFEWLLDPDGDPDTDDAPDVVNNPWGLADNLDECIPEFQEDIRLLKSAGIAVVLSAGNGGPFPATSISPANNPRGFGVGAIDESLTIAYFSSRGPSACDGTIYPDVAAPGVAIITADLTLGGSVGNAYTEVTGTSIAAAHAAGAMALLLSAFPDVKPDDLEWAIQDSAVDLGDPGPDYAYGYGMIDVLEAYDVLSALPPTTTTSSFSTSTSTSSASTSSTSSSTSTIPSTWPIAYARLWVDRTDDNVRKLRMFRDEVLSHTEAGKDLIAMLYDNSLEIACLMVQDEMLMENTRATVNELLPGIESLLLQRDLLMKRGTFNRCLSLLDHFEATASPKLQSAIRKVKSDLHREDIREQLGITITR